MGLMHSGRAEFLGGLFRYIYLFMLGLELMILCGYTPLTLNFECIEVLNSSKNRAVVVGVE